MHITPETLPCGFKVIPFIVNGKENTEGVDPHGMALAKSAMQKMADESTSDRLADNYINPKLDNMVVYSILWDMEKEQPVLATGAQRMSSHCCRLFSRYYLFDDYRTTSSKNRYDKVDNFETDMWHMKHIEEWFPFIFWSRDKGSHFFKRIKEVRTDVFSDWVVHPEIIEILWQDNMQGIIYKGDPEYMSELRYTSFNK